MSIACLQHAHRITPRAYSLFTRHFCRVHSKACHAYRMHSKAMWGPGTIAPPASMSFRCVWTSSRSALSWATMCTSTTTSPKQSRLQKCRYAVAQGCLLLMTCRCCMGHGRSSCLQALHSFDSAPDTHVAPHQCATTLHCGSAEFMEPDV